MGDSRRFEAGTLESDGYNAYPCRVLKIRSLMKSFGRVHAVRGVSLSVERGQIYGLLGPNGSGKTTTMACALGLLKATAGEIEVLGFSASEIHKTRGRVAALFDDATLVKGLSVRQNLEYARRLLGHGDGRGIDSALELVGISELAGQRAGSLSLGQARRVSIARTLIGKPELVVLDEPLSGLDTVGVLEVLALFRRLRDEGVTLLVSSHRMHELEKVVSHVGILMRGELVRESSLDELLKSARGQVRVLTGEPDKALEILRTVDQLGSVQLMNGSRPAGDGQLMVELGGSDAASVNRALVNGGCTVTGLIPEGGSLHDVFESMIDAVKLDVAGTQA